MSLQPPSDAMNVDCSAENCIRELGNVLAANRAMQESCCDLQAAFRTLICTPKQALAPDSAALARIEDWAALAQLEIEHPPCGKGCGKGMVGPTCSNAIPKPLGETLAELDSREVSGEKDEIAAMKQKASPTSVCNFPGDEGQNAQWQSSNGLQATFQQFEEFKRELSLLLHEYDPVKNQTQAEAAEPLKTQTQAELATTVPEQSTCRRSQRETTQLVQKSKSSSFRNRMTAFTRIANIPPDAEQAAERAAEQAAAKQFERLKDQDTNVLSTETFAELVRTHCSGHDLENVVDAITWAVPNPDRLNIRHDGASMNVDMNFEAFSCVCSGEVLKMASHGIKRDLEQIHEALHQEMIHALYEDDDHMPADYRIAIQKPLGISVIFLELMPALVVLCHIIVLGISQDVAPDSIVWVIVDLAFSAFYLCEAIAKMYIFTPKGYFCGPDLAWHWLETVCLIMSILDFIIVQAMQVSQEGLENFVFLRLIRLCRLARLTKVLKSLMRTKLFREVHLMADGMASGARVLVWAVVLIVAINYVLALLANIFFSETLEFTTVASSMCTLFRCFTDGCEDYTGKPLMEQVDRKSVV